MEPEIGAVVQRISSRGNVSFEIQVAHKGLGKYQTIKDQSQFLAIQKAHARATQWTEQWFKQQEASRKKQDGLKKKEHAASMKEAALEQTREAQKITDELKSLLSHTLSVPDAIDWNMLKSHESFPESKPTEPVLPPAPIYPEILNKKPQVEDFVLPPGFLEKIFPFMRERREVAISENYRQAHAKWETDARSAHSRYVALKKEHEVAAAGIHAEYARIVQNWEMCKAEFLRVQSDGNAEVDKRRSTYLSKAPAAIEIYCEMVLLRSSYPDFFPQTFELAFNEINGLLIVDYDLPPINDLPRIKEVKYVQSRDQLVQKELSSDEINEMYDGILYQVAIRTLHELFEADEVDALATIVFNGFVTSIDPATGREVRACLMSVQANKPVFLEINLARIDPKACFKKLKGVGSAALHSMAPVAPLVVFDKEDERFVQSYEVAKTLDEGVNLAAMDWEDFEHLVRELFESEFSQPGSDVKVTRASHDGGVDAIIFDPDPIRGGKFVIQAKRYTNTVGVAAVRDLFGTLQHEGANKGILVTTSVYGPDAYEFAKGKPLQLIDGGNLLHMLAKHGHKAHIDIEKAKQLLAQEE